MSEKEKPETKATLKITDIDMKFKNEVKKIPGGERIMMCFQCGTCTADCPIARFSDSYTCVDHCPQDVEISSVIRALRNIAVKEGYMPPVFKELAGAILETGLAYKIPELRLKRREEAGLPPLPKANVQSVSKLFNQTGFSKMMTKGGNSNAST